MSKLGKFIALEGGEGVGKSTLMQGLSDWFKLKQIDVIRTREPGGTPIADQIRKLFKSPPDGEELTPQAEALLVSASRAQHVATVIQPALAAGQWVLCDRFADSTRVYQGIFGGVPLNDLEWLIRFSTGGLEPDITFLLDCDVAITSARIGNRQDVNGDDESLRYDHAGRQVLDRLRQAYRRVAGFYPSRFFLLDATRSPEDVLRDACAELERRWKL